MTTMEHDSHTVVRPKTAKPRDNSPSGATGTIARVFSSPHRAYGVEFNGRNDRTIAQTTPTPNEIESVAPRIAAGA